MSEEDNTGMTTYSAGLDTSSEPHIVVNADRTVTVPDELKSIAVQFDHDIETVVFDCPRYWDGNDLKTMDVSIIYQRPDTKVGQYTCTDVSVDENDPNIIHFSWLISGEATEVIGVLSFQVRITQFDDSGLVKRWSSRMNTDLRILGGIE